MIFLMGLSETCAQARGQILMLNPIPTINQVLSMSMQDETWKEIGSANTPLLPDSSNKPKEGNMIVFYVLILLFLATQRTNAINYTNICQDTHQVSRKEKEVNLEPHLLPQ